MCIAVESVGFADYSTEIVYIQCTIIRRSTNVIVITTSLLSSSFSVELCAVAVAAPTSPRPGCAAD